MDINDFIKSSTSNEALPFAKQNRHSGENLYLLPVLNGFYLFVQTKDREIIKRIEKKDDEIKAYEIQSLLSKDESLGFASYVYFHPTLRVFGFASRVLSPKFTAFQMYINNLLLMLKIQDISFLVHPLKTEITKTQAMTLPFIGTTRFLVRKDSNLGESFKEFFLGSTNPNDLEVIESFEIVIKPAPRKSLTDTIKKTLISMEDEGIKGIILRGKQSLEDNVKDFYIHSAGALYDEIKNTEENKVFDEIKEKIENNAELKDKVKEYEQEIPEQMDDRIAYLYSPANWASDRVCLFPLSQ
ncbi:hypothetical protein A7907_02970 [Acinetobacter baumannii]|nr:hypothetical protein [Acinetobacter baumannii]KHV80548.1 hypothetical protein RR14_17705 [Acinetobacter baumannii]KHW64287.1 hypothetical protein RQ87_18745 [Acinetobacter baumannii]KHW67823.1 hypothetical protein RQ86_18295 [Acinetobacter baumannii]KHW75713.1 hypothetical protein RQ84_16500 [Acinetobacter baumannii]